MSTKKMRIKDLALLLAIAVLCVGIFSVSAFATEGAIASGEAGEGIAWEISADGTLTISGSGEPAVEWYNPPWLPYKERIRSVVFAEGITGIPGSVICYLENLTTISIPSTVQLVNSIAISASRAITEINVSADNPYYKSEDGILFTKDGAVLVRFPAGKIVEEYTIPESVTRISGSAFEDNRGINTVNIHGGVESIGNAAFAYTTIKEINLSEGLKTIDNSAFSSNPMTEFVVPDSVTEIGNNAFYANDLESFVLGSGIQKIGSHVFAYNSYLEVIHYNGTEETWSTVELGAGFDKEVHFVELKDGIAASCNEGNSAGLYCAIQRIFPPFPKAPLAP